MAAGTVAPVLVVVGETASGKSALALELAEQLGGEIICADSWTVRREVNIGTAKPTAEEQARVRHHLVDVVDPCEDFTAAVFKQLALEAIEGIYSRHKLPIMVGGTGLYVDSVIYNFGFLAPGDREARKELNDLTIPQLLSRIEEQGIELDTVDIRNKRRLIRLLETDGARPTRGELRTNTLVIGLKLEREELRERIVRRTDAMLAAGLEQEAHGLAEKYGWECEALKGVGYREWHDYFLGSQSSEQTRERIIKSTLDLAKRQRTWFKRNKSIHWFTTPVNQTSIVDLATTQLNK